VEPLAKAGQLRVVVATMGLAAGINFSLRSVALAGESYRRDAVEEPIRPDEILQMFGRAGRRGLDETGFVLITANELRLLDARPCHLSRSGAVDWSALLNLMAAAAHHGRDPFIEAVRVQERLFTVKPIFLGVEESLKHPVVPCNLHTDAERARHVRKLIREMLNSRGEWESIGTTHEKLLKEILVSARPHISQPSAESATKSADNTSERTALFPLPEGEGKGERNRIGEQSVGAELERNVSSRVPLRSILTEPAALEKIGHGTLVVLSEENGLKTYGRSITVAERLNDNRVLIAKWIRRLTNWNGRQAPASIWEQNIAPLVEQKLAKQKTPVVRFLSLAHKIVAHVSLGEMTMRVPVDKYGVALWRPVEREVLPYDCAQCSLVPVCKQLSTSTGTALLWRRLNLVDASGVPTSRGRVVSFFSQGDGLAIAAALEDEKYPLDELIYDLANLDAGFRFCGEDNRWGGRLAIASHDKFGLQSIPGYLENGLPPKYGAGAEQIVSAVHKNPLSKQGWVTDLVGLGDIDRVIIEWRSLLRQIAHAPELDWPRWRALQAMAKTILNETESPTLTDLPPLAYNQTKRVDHRLILRRH
jgi:hypothetical protein